MGSLPEKACVKCGIQKPNTPEYFAIAFGKPRGICRVCSNAYAKARYAANPQAELERMKKYQLAKRAREGWTPPPTDRTCCDCGQTFPKGREHFADKKHYCRPCGQKRLQKSIADSIGRRRINGNLRTCTECNLEKENTRKFFYAKMKNGREKLSAVCIDCSKLAAIVRWREKNNYQGGLPQVKKSVEEKRMTKAAARRRAHLRNPLRNRAKYARRRARIKQAGGHHTAAHIKGQLVQQKGKCYWCSASLGKKGAEVFHVDHLFALAKGGGNGPDNIVCACPDCNLSKSDKMPWDFAGRLM